MKRALKKSQGFRFLYILTVEEIKPFSNFILGTADDVVYGTSVQNLETVSWVVENFYG